MGAINTLRRVTSKRRDCTEPEQLGGGDSRPIDTAHFPGKAIFDEMPGVQLEKESLQISFECRQRL